jgi:hypothetical protein
MGGIGNFIKEETVGVVGVVDVVGVVGVVSVVSVVVVVGVVFIQLFFLKSSFILIIDSFYISKTLLKKDIKTRNISRKKGKRGGRIKY